MKPLPLAGRRPRFAAVVGLLAAASAVLGVARLASAYLGPGDRPNDPFAGLPEAEQRARQAQESQRSDATRFELRQRFAQSGQDPRSLERTRRMAITDPPAASFREAVAAADIVVRGTVVALDFADPSARGIVTTIAVEAVLKGPPLDQVLVEQVGDLDVDTDGDIVLGEADYAPVLFKGDQAFLLLTRRPDGSGRYLVQPWSGQYPVQAGRVAPLPANAAIGASARGNSVAAFEDALRVAAAR